MQKILHIVMSLLVIITSIFNINPKEISTMHIIKYVIGVMVLLLIINLLTWLIHFSVDKGLTWFEKKKQSRYSLLTWLGDTSILLELYNELESIQSFNPTNFHENYEITKQKIKQYYTTVDDLIGLKHYLELQTGSQKYTALFNTTQTVLLGIIIPTVLALFNLKLFTSMTGSVNAVIFLILWLMLLNAIDFMANQIDKKKVLLRLVNECITETNL